MADFDFHRSVDRIKIAVFQNSNNAFYGTLMSGFDVYHKPDNEYLACVYYDQLKIELNDEYFKLPEKTQVGIFIHEINHVARLHNIRRGSRNPVVWNYAADYEINNILKEEGYTFEGAGGLFDEKFIGMPAEEIYDILIDKSQEELEELGIYVFDEHEESSSDEDISNTTNQLGLLERAMQAAAIAGQGKSYGPGSSRIDALMDKFKKPKLDWKVLLRRFFTDLDKNEYSFSKRNKRYQDVYLPSLVNEASKLSSITFYMDCSASVSEAEQKAVLNEFVSIKRNYNPEKLSLIQFDTEILRSDIFTANKLVRSIEFVRGGGTDLTPVYEHIMQTRPKVVVVFSDLECLPMDVVPGVELLWVVINNPTAKVNQGRMVHLEV